MARAKIPIRNLYYMLCYAWDRLEQGRLVDIAGIESSELVDLLASVLVKGVQHIARRGLHLGYAPVRDEIRGIRGRLNPYATERRFLSKHGRTACIYDELTADTLPNQIIRSTLELLARTPDLSRPNRSGVTRSVRTLKDVSLIEIKSQTFRRVQINGNNAFYRFLLNVCELVHDSLLPEESSGAYRFREFARDENKMAYVFQYFIYNFLRIERSDLSVFRENIHWVAESRSLKSLSLLPQMQTDISFVGAGGKVIIETKYYSDTLSEFHGGLSLYSANLYQLVSYMTNAQRAGQKVAGILLYPLVDHALDERYRVLGMPLWVKTLDLGRPWQEIHSELAKLPECGESSNGK